MNKPNANKRTWRGLWPAAWLCLALTAASGAVAPAVHAQDAITITQVDPSHFPQMAVYIDAEASSLAAGLTADDFAVTEDGEPVQIVDFAGEGEARPVDVVFVFDTTSSMGGEIDGAIQSSIAFAEQLRAANRDFRLGLVAFGDEIRAVDNAGGSMTADAAEFTNWMRRLTADGGGDDPEAALDALQQATTMPFRPDAQKVLLLITDAPPHTAGDGSGVSTLTGAGLAQTLAAGGFTVYAVAADDPAFHTLVNATGGKFYELTRRTDFTGLIDEIGGDIAKLYRLTYLSPRSSYDGTARNIAISVGGKSGEEVFLEPHLVNIQSSLPIGMGLLAVLLLALVAPLAVGWAGARKQGAPAAPPQPAAAHAAAPAAVYTAALRAPICPACGREVRAGARFCAGCGARV